MTNAGDQQIIDVDHVAIMRMLVLVSVPLSPCGYNRSIRWQYQDSRMTTTQILH